ncbi:MAG: hypothetical protein ABS81_14625 [Pseudonocardia sp. SCN 72-86]|nr:MAG: hypothetical protein ABS81_14625 [Pseudonocardia sp. SCN 72-86]
MNPHLAAARARHESIRTQLADLRERAEHEDRDLSQIELRHAEALTVEAEALLPQIESLTAIERRNATVDAAAVAVGTTGVAGARSAPAPGTASYVSLGGPGNDLYREMGGGLAVPALMPSGTQLAEMLRHQAHGEQPRRWTIDQTVQHRATIGTAQTGVGTDVATAARRFEPRRIATAVRGLAVEHVAGITGVAFPVFGAGAADIAAEGAVKPEYAAVTPGTAVPQVISVWSDYSRQAALSMPTFEARLRNKHAALVARREDKLLVSRLLGVTGAQSHVAPAEGEPYSDAVLAAAGLVLDSDVAAAPDIVLANPADLPKLFPGATAQGLNGTTPDSELRLDLHGALVYPTGEVPAGTAIVAALAASARFVLGLAPVVLIDPVSQLKKNLVTLLTEEACTLAIDEPTGIVLVDFAPSGEPEEPEEEPETP